MPHDAAWAGDRRVHVSGETYNVGGDDLNYQVKQLAHFVIDVILKTTIHTISDEPESARRASR